MATVDHYEVLGVSSKASTEEVKRAYRSLSRQFHPDKAGLNVGEAAKEEHSSKMIALNIAYQVLMSPLERRNFDLSREVPAQASAQAGAYSARSAYAAAAAARRASSARGRPSAPRPPQPAASQPSAPSAGSKAPADTGSTAPPSKTGAFIPMGSVCKPRYQSGGKYSQRARQARRMDPSQYTTHIDGRAHEFEGAAEDLLFKGAAEDFLRGMREDTGVGAGASNTATPASNIPGGGSGASEPGTVRYPTWLQRQLDVAKHWEEVNCPAEPEQEKYQWRKASDNWLRMRERRAREQIGEDPEPVC